MKRSLLLGALAASAVLVGCDDAASPSPLTPSSSPLQGSSDGPVPSTVSEAGNTTAQAFQTLFEQESVDQTNPMGTSSSSLRTAHENLRATWIQDPTDSRTAFALAITGMAVKMNDLAGTMARARDNGLPLGGSGTGSAGTSAGEVTQEIPVLARALVSPAKAPLAHEIQDSLEILLLPTLDSAIEYLDVAWKDQGFSFPVSMDRINFPDDTLLLDRVDVGLALSVLQAFRAEIRWMVAYNLDVDRAGSYDWIDTLSNWNVESDPISPAQEAALSHLQSLVSPGSSFLKVRPSKAVGLASVPGELKAALERSREAAALASTIKGAERHLPYLETPQDREAFTKVLDTGIAWLSGPRQVTLYSRLTCVDSSWAADPTTGYSYQYSTTRIFAAFSDPCNDSYDYNSPYGSYEYHSRTTLLSQRDQTVAFDLSRLLALPDLKVFLPRYQWNPTSSWKADGPYSLIGAAGVVTTLPRLDEIADSSGFDGIRTRITWADPSFGGVFPELQTSTDVLDLFRLADDETASNPAVAATGPLTLF
ncbi:MAG: hypothetical protein H6686_02180 [Fibrobacteria bacterium]|nr:hypothetical protein [Fibrobacteria bacterium]